MISLREQRTAAGAGTFAAASRTRGWTVKTCQIFFRSSHMRRRNPRSRDDMHAVQYLCVFVCLCFCLLVWFARGLCVLPNIYCHNDVWLLREQGFHSREKRGWADNRLGLPLCLCLNARQIHIHAPDMHTIAHICLESLFIWVAYINESTFFFFFFFSLRL